MGILNIGNSVPRIEGMDHTQDRRPSPSTTSLPFPDDPNTPKHFQGFESRDPKALPRIPSGVRTPIQNCEFPLSQALFLGGAAAVKVAGGELENPDLPPNPEGIKVGFVVPSCPNGMFSIPLSTNFVLISVPPHFSSCWEFSSLTKKSSLFPQTQIFHRFFFRFEMEISRFELLYQGLY